MVIKGKTVVVSECWRAGNRALCVVQKQRHNKFVGGRKKDARQGAKRANDLSLTSHDWNVMTIFENPH